MNDKTVLTVSQCEDRMAELQAELTATRADLAAAQAAIKTNKIWREEAVRLIKLLESAVKHS